MIFFTADGLCEVIGPVALTGLQGKASLPETSDTCSQLQYFSNRQPYPTIK